VEQSLVVGMAEIKVLRIKAGSENIEPVLLTALGLGSCVGICLYDSVSMVAGMAHVVLPEASGKLGEPAGKFANVAVPSLVDEMLYFGAARRRLAAAIAGGAQLFTFGSQNAGIGERNTDAVIRALREASIPLLAQDVGGKQGRTVRLSVTDGRVTVRSIGQAERELVTLGESRSEIRPALRPIAARVAA
jgi:chemotaxis protein CheD